MHSSLQLHLIYLHLSCLEMDWQPPALMAETALLSLGSMLDNWLNAAAVLVDERVSGRGYGCESSVQLARAREKGLC